MSDDIVTRLRRHQCVTGIRTVIDDAADEIERLRRNTGCARNQRSTQFCAEALDAQRDVETLRAELVRNADELAATIRELRTVETECSMLRVECGVVAAERDEARREVCGLDADIMEDQVEYARHRGWNCFKDKAACCSTPADGKDTSAGETNVCGLCDQPSDAVNGHGDCMNCARDQYGA